MEIKVGDFILYKNKNAEEEFILRVTNINPLNESHMEGEIIMSTLDAYAPGHKSKYWYLTKDVLKTWQVTKL